MQLSILIPSIPERATKLAGLLERLTPQVRAYPGEVEVLSLIDLRTMSLGEKRNRMMRIAAGKFIIHLDDDDFLVDDTVATLVPIIKGLIGDEDVIAYQGQAFLNGRNPFTVSTSIHFENEQAREENGLLVDIKRKPWHWCCWRRSLALQYEFRGRIDEDWQWLSQVLPNVRQEYRLDKILHVYRHDTNDSFCGLHERP